MNALFWLFWLATLGLCGWELLEIFRRPSCMLEWPFLVCCMWAYFYVYMAYQVKTQLAALVPDWALMLGELMPLACLLAVLYGWHRGMRGGRTVVSRRNPPYQIYMLWLMGMAAVVIGAMGNYSVVHAAAQAGGQLEYASASAYWYLLFYTGYPGLAIALWATYKMPAASKVLFLKFFAVGVFIFMLPNVLNARRGPLFPTILILLLVPPLVKKTNPRRVLFVGTLVAAGFVMLMFVRAREWVYNEGTWSDAFNNLTVADIVVSRGVDVTDNEYLNNCHLIGTVVKTGKYQYGTGHLELLVHWVPRQFWKGKPDLGQGSYTTDELFNDVETVMGARLLGGGAAAGGVADSFIQYGYLCPIMWFLLAYMAGRTYRHARLGSDCRWQLCYVSLLCATHWLVAQGLAAAFVPAMFFQAVPLVIFRLAPRIANVPTQPRFNERPQKIVLAAP